MSKSNVLEADLFAAIPLTVPQVTYADLSGIAYGSTTVTGTAVTDDRWGEFVQQHNLLILELV